MACRNCHNKLRSVQAVYPTWYCEICGTLLEGTEDGPTWTTPVVVAAMQESHAECLREDRDSCVIYRAATEVSRPRRTQEL